MKTKLNLEQVTALSNEHLRLVVRHLKIDEVIGTEKLLLIEENLSEWLVESYVSIETLIVGLSDKKLEIVMADNMVFVQRPLVGEISRVAKKDELIDALWEMLVRVTEPVAFG